MKKSKAPARVTALPEPAPAPQPMAFEVKLPLTTDQALARVMDGLKAEGFGVITRIDAHTVFHEKLGISFRPYTILGACHPQLAHEALSSRPEVGLLLPCNVTVERVDEQHSMVRILNPVSMVHLAGLRTDSTILALMTRASERLRRVADELQAHAHTLPL